MQFIKNIFVTVRNFFAKIFFGSDFQIETVTARELLSWARFAIESDQHDFICFALDSVAKTPAEKAVAQNAKDYIQSLIGYDENYTATLWLAQNHPKFYTQLYDEYGMDMQKVYRLAWIDHLLENDPFFKD